MADGDGGNVAANWGEKKMEGDDGLRTVECLRGRLLAERAASRVAKEDAEQIGNKLIELENQLRLETKSRNRVEKRLKFLMKKLESLYISYVPDESEQSSSLDKSDISSVSSTASSYTKTPEDKRPSSQIKNSTDRDTVDQKTESQIISENLGNNEHLGSANEAISANCHTVEAMNKKTKSHIISENLGNNEHLDSANEAISGKSHELEFSKVSDEPVDQKTQSKIVSENLKNDEYLGSINEAISESSEIESTKICDENTVDYRLKSSTEGKEINGENDQDGDDYVDNSLALVPVDYPVTTQSIGPATANSNVKDVLDALRYAREKLQSSMERRPMIRVGSR